MGHTDLIAALRLRRTHAPWIIRRDGSIRFQWVYVTKLKLRPDASARDVGDPDNLRVHKSAYAAADRPERAQCLAAVSCRNITRLNPIGTTAFSKLKAHLRAATATNLR